MEQFLRVALVLSSLVGGGFSAERGAFERILSVNTGNGEDPENKIAASLVQYRALV